MANKQNKVVASVLLIAALLALLTLDGEQVSAMAIRNRGQFTYADQPESLAESKTGEGEQSASNQTEQANSTAAANESNVANETKAANESSGDSTAKTEAKTTGGEQGQKEAVYAFTDSLNIRATLEKYKGDFNGDLFESLLTGNELPHLLFSELQTLTKKLAEEFPDLITVGSIG